MSNVPYVIEKDEKNNERAYDLYSRLLKDRVIFLKDEFTRDMANTIVAQLLFLESADNESDIYMYVHSPGGYVTAAFAILDTMNYIKPDVVTVGMGQCASAGSFILAGGTKGKRYALPNTEVMIHELAAGTNGKFNNMINDLKHFERVYNRMAEYYQKFTGQKLDKIKKDMQIDNYMTAEEAKEYGLIDEVWINR